MQNLKTKIIFIIGLVMLLFVFLPKISWATCLWSDNTGTVTSPYSATDVQDCVADASNMSGEVIIQIPDLAATWVSGVNVNMNSGWTNVNRLTIKGQNSCVLDVDGRPSSCPTTITNGVFTLTTKDDKAVSLLNIEFNGRSGVNVFGNSKAIRLGYLRFSLVTGSANGGRPIWVGSAGAGTYLKGVADHLYMYNTSYPGIHVRPQGSGAPDGGNTEWMRPLGLGTDDAWYIEDSTFDGVSYPVDCEGSSIVFRHNIVYGAAITTHDAQVGGFRGCRKFELYENDFLNTKSVCNNSSVRGGILYAFNNRIHGNASCLGPFSFTTYRAAGLSNWGGLGYCGSNSGNAILNSTSSRPQSCTSGLGCVKIDGTDMVPQDGHPCRDQLGWDQAPDGSMISQPALFWNNKKCSTYPCVPDAYFDPYSHGSIAYQTLGVDYCTDSSDRGVMPLICNEVATVYTPYVYPHPLTAESLPPSDTTPPAPPGGVVVN